MVPSGEYFDGEGGTGNTPGCAAFVCAVALVVMVMMLINKVNEQKNQIRHIPRQEIRGSDDTVPNAIDKVYYIEQKVKQDSVNLAPSAGARIDLRRYYNNRLIDMVYRSNRMKG